MSRIESILAEIIVNAVLGYDKRGRPLRSNNNNDKGLGCLIMLIFLLIIILVLSFYQG